MNSPTLRPQALSATAVVTQLTQLNGDAAIGWRLIDGALEKRFVFPNFHETMAFANAVAWIAHREDHHPELALNHGHATVRWEPTTPAASPCWTSPALARSTPWACLKRTRPVAAPATAETAGAPGALG
jgi:4a-hydroxytetrahydrobiopterin dehydratase